MDAATNKLRVLTGTEIDAVLNGQETEIIRRVQSAYEAHANGRVMLPFSSFLRLPGDPRNRIIALPAYLGDNTCGVAGIKWISSIPTNVESDLDRASAVVVLNSPITGRPFAVMEGAVISAKRTAASAALAARTLLNGHRPSAVGVIGCGAISFEVLRFLGVVLEGCEAVYVFDKKHEQALWFSQVVSRRLPSQKVVCATDSETVLRQTTLVCIATTAARPHLFELPCSPGTVILHLSLRDIAPENLQDCINIVDDREHICQHETSLHLLEGITGNRDFIHSTLGELLLQRLPQGDGGQLKVFSPFGLGILDLAVAQFAYAETAKHALGIETEFFARNWKERAEENAATVFSTLAA